MFFVSGYQLFIICPKLMLVPHENFKSKFNEKFELLFCFGSEIVIDTTEGHLMLAPETSYWKSSRLHREARTWLVVTFARLNRDGHRRRLVLYGWSVHNNNDLFVRTSIALLLNKHVFLLAIVFLWVRRGNGKPDKAACFPNHRWKMISKVLMLK